MFTFYTFYFYFSFFLHMFAISLTKKEDMNIQTFKSKISKGETDMTKELVIIIDNKEYEVIGTSSSVDKINVIVKAKEGLDVGDSIEKEAATAVADNLKDLPEVIDVEGTEPEEAPVKKKKKE